MIDKKDELKPEVELRSDSSEPEPKKKKLNFSRNQLIVLGGSLAVILLVMVLSSVAFFRNQDSKAQEQKNHDEIPASDRPDGERLRHSGTSR
jgi:flagellar basal body-associated protein FliL